MPLTQVSAGDRINASDLNQFYSILKGVAASGESVTLIYNAAGAIILQPSSDPAVGTQLFQLKNNAGTVKAAMTAAGGALFSAQVNFAQSTTIASATPDLSAATGNYVQISGTTAITALGTVQAGTLMILEFQGILTLTHNGTSLILRSGANATTAAGDIYMFMSEGSGNWREVAHLTGSSSDGSIDSTTLSYWYWMPGIQVESTVTGTGAYTANSSTSWGSINTGATSGSNSGLRKQLNNAFGTGNNGVFETRWWSFLIATDKAASEAWRMFLTDESATGQPSLTAKHLGLRFDGTTVNFSTADGATEQTTAITGSFTASTDVHGVVTFDGTTAKLYLDGVLAATHATNVPTTAANVGPFFRAHITNSAAADKTFYVGPQVVRAVA